MAHHSLHMKGALPDVKGSPAILPLSVAMKQQERECLEALESFSKPVCASRIAAGRRNRGHLGFLIY